MDTNILQMVDVRVFDATTPVHLQILVDEPSRMAMIEKLNKVDFDDLNQNIEMGRENTLIITTSGSLCHDWDMCFKEERLEEAVTAFRELMASNMLDFGESDTGYQIHNPERVIEARRFTIKHGEALEVDTTTYSPYHQAVLIGCLGVKNLLKTGAISFGDEKVVNNNLDMMPQFLNGGKKSGLNAGRGLLGRLFGGK